MVTLCTRIKLEPVFSFSFAERVNSSAAFGAEIRASVQTKSTVFNCTSLILQMQRSVELQQLYTHFL